MALDHGRVFAAVLDNSISETAASDTTVQLSKDQLMDMNSLSGNSFVSHGAQSDAVFEDQVISANEYSGSDSDDNSDRTQITEYEVQEGDNLGGIAKDFGVSLQTIISANNIGNVNAIKPGTKLRIPPLDGLIYKVKAGDTVASLAKKFQAESSKIISYNDLSQDAPLKVGQEVIIPDGIAPKNVAVTTHKDTSSRRFALLPHLDAEFINPATCVITQLIHGFNGVDCANKVGTPIYAAASGTVTVAKMGGYNHGYGNYVRISHPNGTETVYGHFSRVLVSVGQKVQQGEEIGEMGTSGHSTGSHLHLEVRGARNFLAGYGLRGHVIAGK